MGALLPHSKNLFGLLILLLVPSVCSAAAPTVTLVSPPNNAYVSGPTQFTVQVTPGNASGLNCTFYVEPNRLICLNPPCPSINYSSCASTTKYFSTAGTFTATVTITPCTSINPPYLWGASCTDGAGQFGYGGFRNLYYNSTTPCTSACSAGQTQCNGTQIMNCTMNTTSGCYYWKTSACPSGQTCQNGVCSAPNAPPQITYFYPASGTTFDPPGPDKFGLTAVDDRSTVMTCSVYYRPSGGSFSLLREGQVANNTFTETRNSLLDSNPAYDHFTKNFTPGTYNYYFVCTDGEGLTAASPAAAGFGYYHTFYVRSPPCNCTNSTCGAYFSCGYRDAWSCISSQCQPAACGDGFCNWCGFSPCASTAETTQNCPQDCGYACVNDCTNGTSRCVTSYVQTCGNYDSDACTEWGALQNCPAGQNCTNGTCVTPPGAGCTCTSYADCQAKLNSSSCTTITLANDLIQGGGGTALVINGNKIFDGGGHTINGLGGCGYLPQAGGMIDVFGQNAKVRNLRMVDAVHLWVQGGATGATIENVRLENTGSNSAILIGAPDVKVINTTIIGACLYGITSDFYGVNLTDVSISGSADSGIEVSRGSTYACRVKSCNNLGYTDISANTLYGVVSADRIRVSNPGNSSYVNLSCSVTNLSSYSSCFAAQCTNQCSPNTTVATQCAGNAIMQNCTLNATTGCYYWKNTTCGTNQVCITPASCTAGQPCGNCTNSYLYVKVHSPQDGSTPALKPPICNPLTGWCTPPYIDLLFNVSTNLYDVGCSFYVDNCLYFDGSSSGWGVQNSTVGGTTITVNDLVNATHSMYIRCFAPGGPGSISNTSATTTFNFIYSNTTVNLPNSDCSPMCTKFYRLSQNSPANGATVLWTSNPVINYTVQAEACDYSTMEIMAAFVVVDDCAYFDVGFFTGYGYGQLAGAPYGYEMFSMYLYSSLMNGPHTWKVELRGKPLGSCGAYNNTCMPILLNSTAARTFTVTGSSATQNNYGYCYYRTSNCTNECNTAGQTRCNGTMLQTCAYNSASGCYYWNASTCPSGQACSNGTCASSCTDECLAGEARCTGTTGTQNCTLNSSSGCYYWGGFAACASGQNCQDGSCGTCPLITNLAPGNGSNLSSPVQFSMMARDPNEADGFVDCALFVNGGQKTAWSSSSITGTTLTEQFAFANGLYQWNWQCRDSENCTSNSDTWDLWIGAQGCLSDSECASGCCNFSSHACQSSCQTCNSTSQCPPGYECSSGVCTDCTGGNICNPECASDPDCPANATCVGEGGTIPVIANPPSCCAGLALIPPESQDTVGISGICTANCGDGVCDNATESSYNCPHDCVNESCAQDSVCVIGCANDPDCTDCPNCPRCPIEDPGCCQGVNCGEGETCINGLCGNCTQDGNCNPVCDGLDPDCSCVSDSSCPPGSLCLAGYCTKCNEDNFCNPFCPAGVDSDCGGGGGGDRCAQDNVCVIGCAGDPDCTDCPACPRCPIENPNCCNGVNCPIGQTCIGGNCNDCSSNSACEPNCDGLDPDCSCTSGAQCPANSTCMGGYCTKCNEDSFCNPFCPAGVDPDCGANVTGCVPECGQGYACVGSECVSCANDSMCVSECASDPDCCTFSSDCDAGETCDGGSCVPDACVADGFCNQSCTNDGDCCLGDGQCPTMGCPKGSDQDCCIAGDGCNELCANDPDCGDGGGGGGGTCTECGADGFCNLCCSPDPDCPPAECNGSSECGQGRSCVNSRCVYTPLSDKSQKNENATYIIIYAPANASLGSVVQLNVTFLNDTPAPAVLLRVAYPDQSIAQVITNRFGHAFFNATLPGLYYYDAFGVHVYMSMVTFVPSPGSPMNETPGMYVILNPGAHQKSLVLPVTISEPSSLTLSVTDEVSRGVPSALNIESPSESVMENETNDSGVFKDDYSELGKYTFTITAKRDAERIFAKINLERMPLEIEAKNDWIVLVFLAIIVLALVLAYFSRKGLLGLFAFGKGVKATIVPSKAQAGKEIEIVLEAGKEFFANKAFYLVLKETNEMFGLETDEKGRATFVPQQKGRYVIQIEGYSVSGDRELVAE